MKLLHTSDWHLGRSLYTRKRYDEFEAFLAWLLNIITHEQVDILLVAGDVFDTTAPSNRAQELYYQFLCRVAASTCRHVVVIAGNHDSPSFLNAPRELLRVLDVHVVGATSENPDNEVIVLKGKAGMPELIVCAVPYLRDRDIRTAEAGESIEDKDRKLVEGIRDHYAAVCARAEAVRVELKRELPIVAMGHLFTAGGKTEDGDGVRELYVGSLAHIGASIFPPCIDYLALGHLHVPQRVGSSEVMRYSGSPIPMGFGEARQQKSVCVVDLAGAEPAVSVVPVPVFQRLERVRGSWDEITARIAELAVDDASIWLEVIYTGDELMGDLRQRLADAVDGSRLEILRVQNVRVIDRVLRSIQVDETLDDLDVHQVFDRCMEANSIPAEQRDELRALYRETVAALHDQDAQAE